MDQTEDTAKEKEFERQVATLLAKGYPKAAGKSDEEFIKLLAPLKEKIKTAKHADIDLVNGHLPFVIVVTSDLVPTHTAMSHVVREGKMGFTKLYPHEPTDFTTIDSVPIPPDNVYLLMDIDRGRDTLNIRPEEALRTIQRDGRSPLTIDEGVAIVTQFPDFLMKNNCFSLLASRHAGDQRVPAIWINAAKQPNLGWCWDRNPHTWLGSASCGGRI